MKFRDKLGCGTKTQQHQGFQGQGATQQPASQHYTHLKTSGNSGLVCLAVLCKGSQAIIMINHKEKLTGVEKGFPGSSSHISLSHPEHFHAKKKKLDKGVNGRNTDSGELCFYFFFWKPAKGFSQADKLQEQGLHAHTVCGSVCLHLSFLISSSSTTF